MRIGVAVSDPLGILATPLTIIKRADIETDIGAILEIVRKKEAGKIIIGMPLMLDGASGRQVEKVQAFADELRRRIEVPIEFRDERLSTVVAKQRVQEARKTVRDTRYDAAAAALVLQSYLDETTGVTEIREDEGF